MSRCSIALLGLSFLTPAFAFAQAAPSPAAAAVPPPAAAPPFPPPAATPPAATPPAAAPPAATPPAAAPPPPPAVIDEPPPPPARPTDLRPIRLRRPFSIAGELGWNGLAGLGANFAYHPSPYFAIDSGLGLALSGIRLGVRGRVNILTGEWTPFFAFGTTYSEGTGDKAIESQINGDKVHYRVLPSSYVQFAGGVNYTGDEGFVFTATTGYSALVQSNTRYVDGSYDSYKEVRAVYHGGLILSVAFGYAF